jgi:ergothioneine biosynthesis protein EgtB
MDATRPGYSADGPEAARALRRGTPADVLAALVAVRARTLQLADDWQSALGRAWPGVPYAAERNPPLWELGHVAWFQEYWIARNRQRARGTRCDPAHARAPALLPRADAWYDSGRVAHRTRWELALPDADGTRDYLARTFERTLALLSDLPPDAGADALYFFRLVALHEMMHAEAFQYMALGLGLAVRGPAALEVGAGAQLQVPAQRLRLGPEPDGGFAFDNELQPHAVDVAAFRIDTQPLSWARYLPFVEAGGYEDLTWWSDEGRRWLAAQRVRFPLYLRWGPSGWEQAAGGRWQRLRLQEAAQHLSAHEAEAWCRWSVRRLPTEPEWECAARTQPGFLWGHAWEWTASVFAPYAGFAPHPYRDYSLPWFGTRRVLRGAGAATSPALAHACYRNFFEPHRRDVYAGLRSCAP